MKKKVLLFFAILLVLSFFSCGDDNETKESLPEPSQESIENETKKSLPEVSQSAIETVSDSLLQDQMIKDVYIEINNEEEKILFSIIVNNSINEEHAMEIADSAVRQLAAMASYSNELESPTKDDLGELYDFYDIIIGIGTGPDNVMFQGAKARISSKIKW